MRLSRDKIQRMINAGGGSSSGGGGGSDIAGGATQAWVNMNYVSIEFFRKVFKVWAAGETSSDPDVEIMPNDITTTVKNIQAQAGLWTEAFLSALGQGSGGGTGGATTLDQLDDVVITSPTNGQALIYNATSQMWVNGTIQSGTDMATVWSALAAATNEQINASHLSGVLADYVTATSLQTILGDYLTQTAADQRYITIAYFDRLFRAYNGDTLVSHNDTTTTIDNIKAMFGFWTDMYLSALGRNSAATGLGIDNLTDVTINTPTDGQVLQYNATSSKWENATLQMVTTLAGLSDVLLTSVSANQVLIYNSSSAKWVNTDLKTINGNSIIGSGDIQVGSGGGGGVGYLPLSGGTMTGSIRMDNVSIRDGSGNWIVGKDGNSNGAVSLGSTNITQKVVMNNSVSSFSIENNGETYVKLNNSDQSLYIFNQTWFGPSGNTAGRVDLGRSSYRWGNIYAAQGYFSSSSSSKIMELRRRSSGAATMFFHPNNSNNYWEIGADSTGKFMLGYSGGSDIVNISTNGKVGIGGVSPINYTLHVKGDIYSTGAITALSDMREKDMVIRTYLTVHEIANAPAFSYYWKDKKAHDELLHVGSSAQYWKSVLPEVVLEAKDEKGTLSMQYGVAALVSAITIARKVVDHEQRIRQLEKENEELKKQLNAA